MFCIGFHVHKSLTIGSFESLNSSFSNCKLFFEKLFDFIVFTFHVIVILTYFPIWLAVSTGLQAFLPSCGAEESWISILQRGISSSYRVRIRFSLLFEFEKRLSAQRCWHTLKPIGFLTWQTVKSLTFSARYLMSLCRCGLPCCQCVPCFHRSISSISHQMVSKLIYFILQTLFDGVKKHCVRLFILETFKLLPSIALFARFWEFENGWSIPSNSHFPSWFECISVTSNLRLELLRIPTTGFLRSVESFECGSVMTTRENVVGH
jgi:hypothetical protein